jgi:hypothetical protein
MPRRKNLSKSILASDDGWSTIPGRGRPILHLDSASPASRSPSPPPTDPELSRLASALSRARETVRGVAQLEELWEAVRTVRKSSKVERVIVLGLGSLVGRVAGSALLQLAVVEEILALLDATATAPATETATTPPRSKIQTIFRDPAFTSTDLAFLQQQQHTTESPDSPLDLSAASILIAPHLEFTVVRAILKTGWNPVLLLANDLKLFLDLFAPPPPLFFFADEEKRR